MNFISAMVFMQSKSLKDDIMQEKLTGVASTSCPLNIRKYVLHYNAMHAGLTSTVKEIAK